MLIKKQKKIATSFSSGFTLTSGVFLVLTVLTVSATAVYLSQQSNPNNLNTNLSINQIPRTNPPQPSLAPREGAEDSSNTQREEDEQSSLELNENNFSNTQEDNSSNSTTNLTGIQTESDPIFTLWNKQDDIKIKESQIKDLQDYLTDLSSFTTNHLTEGTTNQYFTSNRAISALTGQNLSLFTNDTNYLTQETDPIFSSWNKSTGITITESQITNLQSYLTSISGLNISLLTNDSNYITDGNTNWDNEYGFITNLSTFTTDNLTQGTTNLYSQWATNTTNLSYTTGNVGIGTTTPHALLHLSSTSGGEGILFTDTSASTGNKQMRIQFHPLPGGTSPAGIIFQKVNDDNSWGADLLTIRNNGYLGVGTNTPSYKLDVNGTGRFSDTLSITSGGLILTTGNLGIGTTTPQNKLHLFTGDGTSGLRTSLVCSNSTSSKLLTDASGNLICGVDQTGSGTGNLIDTLADTLAAGNDANNLGIINLGNIGIGTTTPTTALQIGTSLNITSLGVISGASGNISMWTNNSGYITDGNTNWDNSYGFLTSYTEADPVFSASQAHNITASHLTILGNTSNTNTGDETQSSIQTKLGTATTATSGYLTSTDWNTFNSKQPAGSYLTGTKVDSFNTRTGAVTLSSSDVTTALTFTPYNATNPAGYISSYTETDSVFLAWNKSTGISITESQISNLQSYLTNLSTLTTDNLTQGSTNLYSQWATSGSNISYTTGNVGIGTASPASLLSVGDSSSFQVGSTGMLGIGTIPNDNSTMITRKTWTTEASLIDKSFTTTIDLSSDETTSHLYYAVDTLIRTTNDAVAYNSASQMRSFTLRTEHQGTTTFPDARGMFLDVMNSGAGTLTSGIGTDIYFRNSGGGTFTNGYGVNIRGQSGTLSNITGFRMNDMTASGNTIGMSSSLSADTNKYHLYLSGTAKSYFGGNVGIGTTSPSSLLDLRSSTGSVNINMLTSAGSSQVGTTFTTTGGTGLFQLDQNGNMVLRTAQSGLYFDALGSADMHFRTTNSGLERVTILNDGNVGIGTTGPGFILDVRQATAGTTAINFANSHTIAIGDKMALQLSPSGGYFPGKITVEKTGTIGDHANRMILTTYNGGSTENANQLVLDSTGNIGIGTTAPGQKLDIYNGRIQLSDGYQLGWGANNGIYGTDVTDDVRIQTAGLARLIVNSSGNVGIGTTGPNSKLEIMSGNILTGGDSYGIGAGLGGGGINDHMNIFSTGTGGAIRFYTGVSDVNSANFVGGTEQIRIQPNGNVGIGTTSPTSRLSIGGAGDNGLNINIGAWTSIGNTYSSGATVFGNNVIANVDTAAGMKIMTTNAGNFGGRAIKMDYLTGITFHANANNVTAGDAFTSELMRITNTGNVGIGTTSPGNKFSIWGDTTLTNISSNASSVTSVNAGGTSLSVLRDGASNAHGGYSSSESQWSLGYVFPANTTISKISWYNIATSERNKHYYIEYLLDGSTNWTKIPITGWSENSTQSSTDEAEASNSDGWNTVTFAPTTAKGFRITITSFWSVGDANAGISEIQMYTSSPGTAFEVTSSGNVGIGTITPSYTLHVSGSAYSTGGWSSSDERWKNNITTLGENTLDKLLSLNPVSYEWDLTNYPNQGFGEGQQLGFIAQQVEPIFPQLVNTDSSGYKSLSYEKLTPILTKAIQQLDLKKADLSLIENTWIPAFAGMTEEQIRMASDIENWIPVFTGMTEKQTEMTENLSQLTLTTEQLTTDYTNLELRVLDLETTLTQRVQTLENWIPAFAGMTAEEINSLVAGTNVQLTLPEEFLSLQQALLENKIEFDAEGNLKVKTIKMEGLEETTRPVCDGSKEGTIYYDKTDKHFYGCNGSVWEVLNNPVIEEELP